MRSNEPSRIRTVVLGQTDIGGLGTTFVGDEPEPIFEELEAGQKLGRYIVVDRIGEGGMGIVYTAYDPQLDRRVALKVLRSGDSGSSGGSDGSARLMREAQAMARLAHPNVISVYDVGMIDGRVFFAMEYVDGPTLTAWLDQRRRSWREVLGPFVLAGRGLAEAHAAGLVHRDFKPDNVLLGTDGRVRVLDFGLAVPTNRVMPDYELQTTVAGSSGLSDRLTETGMVLGTPAYMSPEQHLGNLADARSDQYSFCVALYEGLYGERPFTAENVKELRKQVLRGTVRDAPAKSIVPAWLRHVIRKGLAADPVDRWASMDELLAALDRDAPRRRWLTVLTVSGLVGVGVAGAAAFGGRDDAVCRGAAAKLAGVWDSGRRTQVQEAFVATGVSFAPDTLERVGLTLDAYTDSWIQMHVDACEATNVRHEQSSQLLDDRMNCLHARRAQLEGLVDLLAAADGTIVERAAEATASLPSIAQCGDADALSSEVAPPGDPQTAAQVQAIREGLAKVRALESAGRLELAHEAAAEALTDARALGYGPLVAEALYDLGSVLDKLGDYSGAETHMSDAVWTAASVKHDEVAADASVYLVAVVGYRQARFDEGMAWAQHGEAAVRRTGGGLNEGILLNNIAAVHMGRGNYDAARVAHERGLTVKENILGAMHPQIADSLNNLGATAYLQGQYELATHYYGRAMAIREAIVGPDHPSIGTLLNNLGSAVDDQGAHDEAVTHFRRALEIFEGAGGSDHPHVANALNNLGNALQSLGREGEAREAFERAVEIRETKLGPDHPALARALNNLGDVLRVQKRYQASREVHERALAIREKALGKDHVDVGISLYNLALVVEELEGPKAVQSDYERALEIFEREHGPEHPHLAFALTALGEVAHDNEHRTRAEALLERALLIRERAGVDSTLVADTKFSLAQALWEGPGRDRAVELARQARAAYDADGEPSREELVEVDAWLAKRS